jgi:hypothetical protein
LNLAIVENTIAARLESILDEKIVKKRNKTAYDNVAALECHLLEEMKH